MTGDDKRQKGRPKKRTDYHWLNPFANPNPGNVSEEFSTNSKDEKEHSTGGEGSHDNKADAGETMWPSLKVILFEK